MCIPNGRLAAVSQNLRFRSNFTKPAEVVDYDLKSSERRMQNEVRPKKVIMLAGMYQSDPKTKTVLVLHFL